jgi:hypothetical protein
LPYLALERVEGGLNLGDARRGFGRKIVPSALKRSAVDLAV